MSGSNTHSKEGISLTTQIIVAAILGALLGYSAGSSVSFLGSLGKLFIQLIKAIALPLVFFAIVEAVISTHIPKRKAFRLIFIVLVNAAIAATIGLTLSNLFQAGSSLNIPELSAKLNATKPLNFAGKKLDFVSVISGYVPETLLTPFVEGNMISVVLIAILLGLAARSIGKSSKPEDVNQTKTFHEMIVLIFKVLERVLFWLVHLVPLAVFGVMASTVGEYGFAPFRSLGLYVLAALLGLSLQSFFVYAYWIRIVSKMSLRKFWSEAKRPVIYAFGVNSSLATLPLTLRALDNLGISRASSRLGACVGTNFNNDGILLYEALAVLFVAQAHGIHLTLGEQVYTSFLCVITAMGVAGVPEAGVIALSLVLTTVGMSLEILPLLLTVDWLIARARSVTNVLSDMTVSIALEESEKSPT